MTSMGDHPSAFPIVVQSVISVLIMPNFRLVAVDECGKYRKMLHFTGDCIQKIMKTLPLSGFWSFDQCNWKIDRHIDIGA